MPTRCFGGFPSAPAVLASVSPQPLINNLRDHPKDVNPFGAIRSILSHNYCEKYALAYCYSVVNLIKLGQFYYAIYANVGE